MFRMSANQILKYNSHYLNITCILKYVYLFYFWEKADQIKRADRITNEFFICEKTKLRIMLDPRRLYTGRFLSLFKHFRFYISITRKTGMRYLEVNLHKL